MFLLHIQTKFSKKKNELKKFLCSVICDLWQMKFSQIIMENKDTFHLSSEMEQVQ